MSTGAGLRFSSLASHLPKNSRSFSGLDAKYFRVCLVTSSVSFRSSIGVALTMALIFRLNHALANKNAERNIASRVQQFLHFIVIEQDYDSIGSHAYSLQRMHINVNGEASNSAPSSAPAAPCASLPAESLAGA